MKRLKFKKADNGAYLFPVYVREDGKYTIASVDRWIGGALKRVYEVSDSAGNVIGTLPRLKDAKTSFEME